MSSLPVKEHLSGYQKRDLEIVDYQMSELGNTGLFFRGPLPENIDEGDYFSCIGAAQTLGCFVERAYPSLLSEQLGIDALNLGYGGAGPEFFARQDELIEYINRGKFLVAQVMSGRSQSNSVFETGGLEYVTRRSDGHKTGALEAYRQLLLGDDRIRKLPLGRVSQFLARRMNVPKMKMLVEETRQNWVESTERLFEKITVPIVLFWFSKRTPAYPEQYTTVSKMFGAFPHMIDEHVVSSVRTMSDYYVECVSDRGSPQLLISRNTGEPTTVNPVQDRPDLAVEKPWTHNAYYPSPEMQEDGATALIPVCQKILLGLS